MEYLDHKVLLHPRRAGANASRCWLPVHYGEANALDGSHRPSHHPLKEAPREPSLVSTQAVDVITRIDIGVPLLFWNELNFLSASHCRHSMRFEASQSAHVCTWGCRFLHTQPQETRRMENMLLIPSFKSVMTCGFQNGESNTRASLVDPSWLRSHPSRSMPEWQMFLCTARHLLSLVLCF